jgi:hypothetical protein
MEPRLVEWRRGGKGVARGPSPPMQAVRGGESFGLSGRTVELERLTPRKTSRFVVLVG